MSRQPALDLGLVVAAHGRHVVVETPERERVLCHPRGKRSELVVGDHVHWQRTGDGGVVERLEPRRNLLFRQDEWRTKSFASNLDQVLMVVAGDPPFGDAQLARSQIAAAQAGIAARIVLNKVDLPAAAAARARLEPYRSMGVAVDEVALKSAPDAARAALAPLLMGRTTLVIGPSGSGKSTLVNLMVPDAGAQVGEISRALNAGRHTTTTTRWYALGSRASDGALIDSPGFQAFGLHHIAARGLAEFMPDLATQLGHCRFHNCTHRMEPGCGVRAAADVGAVDATRYRIYVDLFDELEAAGRR